MRIHNITHDDMKNGTGLRVVLWVAGCEHKCEGCQNPFTWNPDYGIEFTPWEEAEFFEWLSKPWTEGVTFSGGDPLHPANRDTIGYLANYVKKKYPTKNIWLYTGYRLNYNDTTEGFSFMNTTENSFVLPWLNLVDVIVDGPFQMSTRKNDIKERKKVLWRGSSNQRIIDVQESIKNNTIVCMEE